MLVLSAATLAGKHSRISFFGSADFGKLVRMHSAPHGYLRTTKTHLGHEEKYTIVETIKRRIDQASKFQMSALFSATFC